MASLRNTILLSFLLGLPWFLGRMQCFFYYLEALNYSIFSFVYFTGFIPNNDDNDNDVTTYIFVICNGSYGLFELLYTLMRNKQVPDLKFLIETMQQQFNAVKVKAKNI